MATLPTAYASLRFGRKTIDFYAVTGEVVGSDPRARAEERRIQDLDGARHTLRLMEKGYRLEPGDSASVLRLQPGPERRSRPVAVASPSAQSWSRTHPGVPALLSRAGVSRNVNWWLTMTLFALAALAIVWPYLHAFLIEVAPGRIGALPAPDLFALAAASVPGLEAFRWSEAAGGLTPLLDAAGPGLAGQAGLIAFAAAVAAFAVLVYAARSWRLVWAPVFVALAVFGAIGLSGVEGAEGPALAALGVAALLFVAGGVVNRLRDEARLDKRIALLAEHLVSQTPVEHVRASRLPEQAGAAMGASTITASALREPSEPAEPDVAADAEAETPSPQTASDVEAAPPDGVAEAAPAEAASETTTDVTPAAGAPGAETLPDAAANDAAAPAEAAEAAEAEEAVETSDAARETRTPDAGADAQVAPQADARASAVDALAAKKGDADTDAIEADGFVDPDLSVAAEAAAPEAVEAPGDAESIEEARLRDDPRYAARAIVLPAPPPMPRPETGAEPAFAAPADSNAAAASNEAGPDQGEAEAEDADADSAARTPETTR
ncbi:MAG: hypothetical protein LAT81_07450 [Oceanicaulis sp.]|nr:hypothetical protein [Oceanicaulis sp.]